MCGIAGIHLKDAGYLKNSGECKSFEALIDALLMGIENRGTDSTGIVAVSNGATHVELQKEAIPATGFITIRKPMMKGVRTALLHTRFATQGLASNPMNNHPVAYGTVFTTHNGTIRNDDALFEKHKLKRFAEVDTEIIPALLNKFGFDKAEEAFGELSGGFATASVDPINNKDQVLLCKGGTWPLVYLNLKPLIVWASTKEALTKALAVVFEGTNYAPHYEELAFGDILRIDGDNITKHPKAFTSPVTTTVYQHNNYHWLNGYDDDDDKPWWHVGSKKDRYGNNYTRRYVKPQNRSLEAADLRGSGKSKVCLYDERTEMTPVQIAEHTGKWVFCTSCKDTVREYDMIDSLVHGRVCQDCLHLAYEEAKKKGQEDQYEQLGGKYLTGMELRDLEKWAEKEAHVNIEAVGATARRTGLKYETVDYLIFRSSDEYRSASDAMTKLYMDLSDVFEEEEQEAWKRFEPKKEEKVEQDEDEFVRENYYVSCAMGTHRVDEECEACDWMYEPGVNDYEDIDYDEEDACCIIEAEPPTEKRSDNLKCMKCRKKAKVFAGPFYQWCEYHFGKCSVRSCKEETKSFATEAKQKIKRGDCLCHKHGRGIKSKALGVPYPAEADASPA